MSRNSSNLASLSTIRLLVKLYAAYAFSLAFILQSSVVLLMAFLACGLYILLRSPSLIYWRFKPQPALCHCGQGRCAPKMPVERCRRGRYFRL